MTNNRFLKFIGNEWMLCAIYTVLIIIFNIISILYAGIIPFLNYLLFLMGFSVSSGFMIVCSQLFHGEKLVNPMKEMVLGQNKLRWDIVTYFIFVGIVSIPIKLLALAASLFPWSQSLLTNIQTNPTYALSFGVIVSLLYVIYKSILFLGLANLIYNRDEVISSLKFGVMNLVNCSVVVVVFLLNSLLYSFVGNSYFVLNKLIIGSINYLIPGYLTIYIYTKFRQENA